MVKASLMPEKSQGEPKLLVEESKIGHAFCTKAAVVDIYGKGLEERKRTTRHRNANKQIQHGNTGVMNLKRQQERKVKTPRNQTTRTSWNNR